MWVLFPVRGCGPAVPRWQLPLVGVRAAGLEQLNIVLAVNHLRAWAGGVAPALWWGGEKVRQHVGVSTRCSPVLNALWGRAPAPGWVPWGWHWDRGGGLCSPGPHPTVGWGLWGGSAQPRCLAWLRFPVWLISTQLS